MPGEAVSCAPDCAGPERVGGDCATGRAVCAERGRLEIALRVGVRALEEAIETPQASATRIVATISRLATRRRRAPSPDMSTSMPLLALRH